MSAESLSRALSSPFNEDETDASYGRELLGRIFAEKKDPTRAMVHYKRALEGQRPTSDNELVAEFLAMLEEAGKRRGNAQLRDEQVSRTLAQLQQQFPADPLVALANVRSQVSADSRNPDLTVGRVSRALREFRERTGHKPLEALRRGSAEAWVMYLLTVAPDLAEALVREDLGQTPGNVDLWVLLARTRAERGHADEALKLYRSVVAMSNDPRAHHGVAWMLAERGGSQNAIESHLRSADEAVDSPRASNRSTFVRVRAELLDPNPNLPGIIDALEKLWRRRRLIGQEVPALDLGRVYVRALMARRSPEDIERLASLGDEYSRQADDAPYSEHLARALAGLSTQLEPRDPEELEAMEAESKKSSKKKNKRGGKPKGGNAKKGGKNAGAAAKKDGGKDGDAGKDDKPAGKNKKPAGKNAKPPGKNEKDAAPAGEKGGAPKGEGEAEEPGKGGGAEQPNEAASLPPRAPRARPKKGKNASPEKEGAAKGGADDGDGR